MTRVVGLDPSLTGYGIARVEHGQLVSAQRLRADHCDGHERLEFLLDRLSELAAAADLVVIEGPALGSYAQKQRGHHERAGLWWMTTHQLWLDHVPYAVVSPTGRAKYATGSGASGKAAVVAAVSARYGAGPITDDNVADALVLAAMGARAVGEPLADGTTGRALDAVAAVTWPKPRRAAAA